ncbi:MAG: MFS transporter [Candidatus Zixiibacteriota bacterium]|nr:MAG: MFS transporter [candidate division Zixibacteria bacterium]
MFTVGAIGTFMATLDGSILNVALPTISRDLNCSVDVVAWVILAYTLTLISLLLVFGVWSGKRGYSFSYKFGYALFIAGSAICAVSGSIYTLVFGRVIQGTGSAMFAAVGPGMVTQVFPASQRGKGIGMMVMMVSAGFMVGPPLGGFLLDRWHWPAIFVINIPVGLIGLLMTFVYFRNVPPTAADRKVRLRGAVAMSAALVTGSFALSLINDYPLSDVRIWGLVLLSVTALVTFFKYESDRRTAMIGLNIFKNRQFTSSIGAMLLMFIATSGVLILIPFYLEQIKHFRPQQVGLYLIILPVLMFVFAPLSGRLSDRIGFRFLTSFGTAVLIVGLYLLAGLDVGSTSGYIILSLVVLGAGVGIFNTPNSSALMGSVRVDQRAVTSSILATTRNIGMSVGVALSTALFTYFQVKNAALGGASEIFMASYHTVIHVAMFVAVIGFIFCLTRQNRPTS